MRKCYYWYVLLIAKQTNCLLTWRATAAKGYAFIRTLILIKNAFICTSHLILAHLARNISTANWMNKRKVANSFLESFIHHAWFALGKDANILHVLRSFEFINWTKQKWNPQKKKKSHISATMTTVWIHQIELGHGHTRIQAVCISFYLSVYFYIRILFLPVLLRK